MGSTGRLWYCLYCMNKNNCAVYKNSAENSITAYQALHKRCLCLKHEIKEFESLCYQLPYHKHLAILAEKMPSKARFTCINFCKAEVFLEGQTYDLEDILGCTYALNETKLFEGLHVTELQPGSIVCEAGQDEKKLVNFVIKGKLKEL
jgi:hypothetical protein